ncbi:flagellar hook-associated protein FlgK [Salinarimonas soli]|uniref:Flagellar hook-associated protein 1 n=1 Tax=Salinarimonas soli TaxID=1638099 RepID=A0A5B2V8D2_9HYPH|nr:flagellar hook-associated protein FlgK [Salinarimonas soli]KAA2234710.1 flagellar hook-associated protein FlgK [Salinarimonas soli]
MSLSVALNSAQSSLSATASQTAITSRNISGAGDASYSRKAGIVTTLGIGSVRVGSVQRATDMALFLKMLGATSTAASSQAQLDGLKALAQTVGDPENDTSLAGALGKFSAALQTYGDTPSDTILARNLLNSAKDLAGQLNDAQAVTQGVRQKADGDIAASVDQVNSLLAKFEVVNRQIVFGTVTGADVTDQLDVRDKLLSQISEEMGVSVVHRANNDVALYTDSGVTLFEKTPRTLTFARTFGLGPGSAGAAVVLDGVPITGPTSTMPIKSGRIFGNAVLRDDTAVTYQRQIDEAARGLIEAFSEGGGGQGLFTAPGYPAATGLAGAVRANPLADPEAGGSLARLRDGFTVAYNPTNDASFSGRLQQLIDGLSAPRAFSPAAGINPTASLTRYMAASASWLEGSRKQANDVSDYNNTFLERTSEALSNQTGVNLDEELALMLELERSYGASARVITVVDTMLKTLLDAARP